MKKIIIYYLLNDYKNEREIEDINYLSQFGRLVLITSSREFKSKKYKKIYIKKYNNKKIYFYYIWTKICVLISKIPNSKGAINLDKRNIYIKNRIIKLIINKLWFLKKIKFINAKLFDYENIFLFPFKIILLNLKRKKIVNKNRVIIYDSVLIRLEELSIFLAYAKKIQIPRVANVKSWDNPSYTQFSTKADGYLVWNMGMWNDIKRFHNISKDIFYFSWGARQFIKFQNLVDADKTKDTDLGNLDDKLVIGYAAAFGEKLLGGDEVDLIVDIAKVLEIDNPKAKILYRPYPTAEESLYEKLKLYPNITIANISDKVTDRYGDGREFIKFGSVEEKLEFLKKCDYFISIGTTFTIEACIVGVPVINLYIDENNRYTLGMHRLFERVDIADHILNYFVNYLDNVNDINNLNKYIKIKYLYVNKKEEKLKDILGLNIYKVTELNSGLKEFLNNLVEF